MENVNIINNEAMINTKPKDRRAGANTIAIAAVIFCGSMILSALSGCGVEDRRLKNIGGEGGSGVKGDTTQQTQDSGRTQDSAGAQGPGEGQETAQSGETIAYEIPDGWQWTDLRKRDAIRMEYVPGDAEGILKLGLLGVSEGDAASAESSVKKMYETYKTDCLNQGQDCPASPEYMELDMDGVKVYCAMSASRSFSPDIGWSTYLEFAKNGGVAGFMLYDRADRQKDLLGKVTSTITWQ